jgi:TRAP-type C4-dicarboxylate transport system substrate-binding protein
MKKKVFFGVVGVFFAFALLANPGISDAKTIKMRIIHAYPDTTQHGRNMFKFQELTEKYTNGRVKVTLFANASVCPITKEVTTVLTGGAEACYNIGGIIESVDKAEAIWTIPFLFRNAPGDVRHIRKAFLDPRIEGVLKERQMKKGLYRLGTPATVDGFFFGCNTRPIKKLEDFKGLKMRHPGGLMGEIFYRGLGASAIVVPGTEVPVALQTGVVDGLTTVPQHYHDARWHTKYATVPYWCTYSLPFLANLKWWKKLPADIRDIFDDKIMPEVMEFAFQEMETRPPETFKIMQKPPFNVQISTFPREELRRMKDATQAACIKKYQEVMGKDLADSMIQAARELTPKDMLLD